MKNQDDAGYCKLLAEVLENCEKELEKERQEFNVYVKEREEQEKYVREAIAEEYNKVLDKIEDSYEALVQRVKKELDQNLLEYHTKTELTLDQKMNETLRDIELELQHYYNKLVQKSEALDRQFDKEWYEVDQLRMDLLKINTQIERYFKSSQTDDSNMAVDQFHVDQIHNKNIEIIRLYDRLSQNLLNKITQIEDDINRMEHLCNYLQSDDVANKPQNINIPDRNQSGVKNQYSSSSIDYEAVD